MASELRTGLKICWTKDFALLQRFVAETLKLDGVWLSPGGDKKVFNMQESSLSWRKSNKVLCFNGDNGDDLKFKFCSVMCEPASTEESVQRESDSNNLNNTCTSYCRCNEVIPDVEGLTLDFVVTEKATQMNAENLCAIKGELKKIFERQNDLQNQLENLRMTKITEAPPSSLEYANSDLAENTTPTAAFVTSVSECNSGMKRTSSDYLNSEIPDNTAPTTALKDSIAENNTVEISMALEHLADSDGFENTTPTAARDVSIVESKDVNEGALSKYTKNTNTENLLVAPSAIASTIHDQSNDRSETSTNCNAKLKEISNKNATIRKHTDIHNRQKHNNKLVNNGDIQDVQRIPVRITQRSYKKNKPKRKSNSNMHPIRRYRLGFHRIYDKTSKTWANHLDLVRTVTYGTLV